MYDIAGVKNHIQNLTDAELKIELINLNDAIELNHLMKATPTNKLLVLSLGFIPYNYNNRRTNMFYIKTLMEKEIINRFIK